MRKDLMPWLMWILTLSFFMYQFVMRLAPGLLFKEIMVKFGISATDFGVLSSMYYFGYAGLQIPVAMLLDRYGPRLVVSFCIFICSLSTLTFIFADYWWMALIGRFLIGAGSAAGFLGVSKVISLYFPTKHYGRMVGLSFTFGLMGALYGGKPLNSLMEMLGWERVLELVSMVGIVLALCVLLFVKNPPNTANSSKSEPMLKQLKAIIKNPVIISMALANLLLVGPLEGFADIWGVSYLIETYNFTKNDAATVTSAVFFGMLFGGPILAAIAEKLNAYSVSIGFCGVITALIFFFVLLSGSHLSHMALCGLMFVVGIMCCYQVLVLAYGSLLVKPEQQGLTIAFLNSINMLGGSFFHSTIGFVLDKLWDGSIKNGVKLYSASNYSYALLVIPVAAVVGGLYFLYLSYIERAGKSASFGYVSG